MKAIIAAIIGISIFGAALARADGGQTTIQAASGRAYAVKTAGARLFAVPQSIDTTLSRYPQGAPADCADFESQLKQLAPLFDLCATAARSAENPPECQSLLELVNSARYPDQDAVQYWTAPVLRTLPDGSADQTKHEVADALSAATFRVAADGRPQVEGDFDPGSIDLSWDATSWTAKIRAIPHAQIETPSAGRSNILRTHGRELACDILAGHVKLLFKSSVRVHVPSDEQGLGARFLFDTSGRLQSLGGPGLDAVDLAALAGYRIGGALATLPPTAIDNGDRVALDIFRMLRDPISGTFRAYASETELQQKLWPEDAVLTGIAWTAQTPSN
jgi:hypothetical protein